MSVSILSIKGEAINQEFFLIPKNPIPEIITPPVPHITTDCCSAFSLFALADVDSDEELRNDVSGFLFWFSDAIATAEMKLQKWNGSAWVNIATLTDNTYGIFYAFEFFVNDAGEKFIGYQLNWKDVLTINGEASYRIKCNVTDVFSGTGAEYSNNYCLLQFTNGRADKTVKIEYYLSGQLGMTDDKLVRDLGELNWYNSIRLYGFFGFPSSTYESDYIQYSNGQKVWVEDSQEAEYTLKLNPVASFAHDLMRTDVLQADRVEITDYNSKNPHTFVKKAVIKNSDYSPKWNKMQNQLASVEVKFIQEYNNNQKLRC